MTFQSLGGKSWGLWQGQLAWCIAHPNKLSQIVRPDGYFSITWVPTPTALVSESHQQEPAHEAEDLSVRDHAARVPLRPPLCDRRDGIRDVEPLRTEVVTESHPSDRDGKSGVFTAVTDVK